MTAATAAHPFLERVAARVRATGGLLCLGLDPEPGALPPGFPAGPEGVERFARLLLDAAGPYAAAVKPNLAFWEAFGSPGLAALERVRRAIPSDLPVLADAKRGDIGSTAAKHAAALFDTLGADAVTVSPYLGGDALGPILARGDRFAFVLCRTSNPGAGELQSLRVAADAAAGLPEEPLYLRVARHAHRWGERHGNVGLVVGATAPDELRAVRATVPDLAFLVPGVGAQGGEVEVVLAAGRAEQGAVAALPGGGLLVNVSRGISAAALGRLDAGAAVAAAAAEWSARLAVLA
ncbi:MAG TPA: orotidine-5'-phosphate decarboxylase [Candidatus Limnocylindrales bacterium]|nr:orotidine-5'-phosphate decarboxylase [Candidatus Limnocylindrales bacterium]